MLGKSRFDAGRGLPAGAGKGWLTVMIACALALSLAGAAWAGERQPRVGLALSGGGARGLAHIGVLEVLGQAGVPVDLVAGTSMGSIIGGLYCAGYRPDQITEMVAKVDWKEAFSSTPARQLLGFSEKDESQRYLLEVGLGSAGIELPTGLLSGYKLTALLTRLCLPVAGVEDFDRLGIPYRAVATDLATGEAVVLGRGSLAQAMRASMSIPGVFPPFELDGRLLVDGGVVQNLPVQTVKDMGADLVIGVNVSTPLRKRGDLGDVLRVMDQTISIQMILATQSEARQADLVIAPYLEGYSNSDFDQSDQLRQRGREAALAALPRILTLLEKRGVALTAKDGRPGLRPVAEIVVGKVSVEGPAVYHGEVRRLMPIRPGQKVSADELDQGVQKIYGQGMFESVSYRVRPLADGQSELVFVLKEKGYGQYVTRLGMYLEASSNRSNDFTLLLNLRRPNLLYTGAHADLNLSAGRTLGGDLRLSLPNQPWEGFIFQPDVFYYSTLHNVYQDQTIKAEYRRDSRGVDLSAAQELGTWGQFRLGYVGRVDSISPRIATTEVPEADDFISALIARLRVDTLDRIPYPRRGFASDLSALRSFKELGADLDFTRLVWEAAWVWPLGKAGYLIPNWTLGTSLDANPSNSQLMFLGGYPGLLGAAQDEFVGQEVLRFQLRHLYPLGDNLHLITAANFGAAGSDVNHVTDPGNWYWGGGGGLGVSTPLGPLELLVGVGEGARFAGYLVFGFPLERSIGRAD
ncbi:MAG: patatin-like phospholipase family protein [Thermodesulfobacteriota bacterium]